MCMNGYLWVEMGEVLGVSDGCVWCGRKDGSWEKVRFSVWVWEGDVGELVGGRIDGVLCVEEGDVSISLGRLGRYDSV